MLAMLLLRSPLAHTLTVGIGSGIHLLSADLAGLRLPLPDEALASIVQGSPGAVTDCAGACFGVWCLFAVGAAASHCPTRR
jgi:hypothetical protein